MLYEASEWTLKRSINDWLTRQYSEGVVAEVARDVKASKRALRGIGTVSVEITGEDFGALIVQLRALGLITKSERARSVKDTATYWSLTPYRDEHLTALRARRREEPDSRLVETDER